LTTASLIMKTPTPAGEWAFLTRIDGTRCLATAFGEDHLVIAPAIARRKSTF
jgi:hypothetical protein